MWNELFKIRKVFLSTHFTVQIINKGYLVDINILNLIFDCPECVSFLMHPATNQISKLKNDNWILDIPLKKISDLVRLWQKIF